MTEPNPQPQGQDILAAALEYLDKGWSIMPLHPETKYPRIKWEQYQDRQPFPEEVELWWRQWPDSEIGLITGAVSGVVVVDCDDDAALAFAIEQGMTSPIRVKTRKGWHLYFKHPRDGVRRGPRVGSNSRGVDWPRVPGLDFRADGGYAKLPPSAGYAWHIPAGLDPDDDMPVWQDWRPTASVLDIRTGQPFDISQIDLSHISERAAIDGFDTEWDRTRAYVDEHFPETRRLPTGQGHGRNERLMRVASDEILAGNFGPSLRVRARLFMREFFAEPLPDAEFEATCASMEQAERRNHPDRFDDAGNYVGRQRQAQHATGVDDRASRLIFASDADELMAQAAERRHFIEPWLFPGTIVQVHGYSGSGKSLFLQHALYACAAGARSWGPFHITAPARCLIIDMENGPRTIASRLQELRQLYGDAGDRFAIWTPFRDQDMTLASQEGLRILQEWIEWYKPDVVMIDTVRSAWPGLSENDADAWAPINRLALRLRNAGYAVVLVAHSNKGQGENQLGREAGSTNQLTVLETQIRVAAVYRSRDDAYVKGGVHDAAYETPVWPQLQAKMPPGGTLQSVVEIRYGKVREFTDEHDAAQWVGYGQDARGNRVVVSSMSTRQKAKLMALNGASPPEIAGALSRPTSAILRWLGIAP